MLCEPISNGFYSVVPDKRVKELYNRLPTPNELHALGEEGVRIEVILVDFQKDKKLAMLKQLIHHTCQWLKSCFGRKMTFLSLLKVCIACSQAFMNSP
ncbi:unnamed protein product [Brassica napus]|uniref:(rape) hypothetical protein n=1 Tax=Brassica napus TaxID=3708 RepID=A0A816LW08_BRANA|nr:unnamed protein product [Brassica napus]